MAMCLPAPKHQICTRVQRGGGELDPWYVVDRELLLAYSLSMLLMCFSQVAQATMQANRRRMQLNAHLNLHRFSELGEVRFSSS